MLNKPESTAPIVPVTSHLPSFKEAVISGANLLIKYAMGSPIFTFPNFSNHQSTLFALVAISATERLNKAFAKLLKSEYSAVIS